MTPAFDLNITYEDLLAIKRQNIRNLDPNLDYRETSLLYNSTIVNTIELKQMIDTLRFGVDLTFADTAPREYLIRRAAERGITPEIATRAIRRGTFNIDVGIGARFSLGDNNYITTELTSPGVYNMQCEQFGVVGNVDFGNLIPIQYIDGLTSAILGDVLIPGEDEETTENIRRRYRESFQSVAFAGNRADYKSRTNALPGVGGTRVIRAINGPGTVGLIIINSQYLSPSPELVATVQQAVDPIGSQGEGLGFAPIDHVVKVSAVGQTSVNVTLNITYQSGFVWEDIRVIVTEIINQYLIELSTAWAQSTDDLSTTIVRISQIESRLISVIGVTDIANTLINGNPVNLEVSALNIPRVGVVVG